MADEVPYAGRTNSVPLKLRLLAAAHARKEFGWPEKS